VKTGSASLQKPPHLPLILGSNQAETNSHKNLVKSLTSGRGGMLMKGRWLYAQNYLLDFGPVGAKDDHSQTPFEWVGSAECDRVALKALYWGLIPN
jgi:hypothetical protein